MMIDTNFPTKSRRRLIRAERAYWKAFWLIVGLGIIYVGLYNFFN